MAGWADFTLGQALRKLSELPEGRLVLSQNDLAEFEVRDFIRSRLQEWGSNPEQIVNELFQTKFLRNMLRHWVETEGFWMDRADMIQQLEFYEERNRQRRPGEQVIVNQAEDLDTPF
jgi:hypothetical protein